MPQPGDYYRIYAIRTGSAEYAHHILASAWLRKGWVGTKNGLRKKEQCRKKGKTWECYVTDPALPPVWRNEFELFRWLGIQCIDPMQREFNQIVNTAL